MSSLQRWSPRYSLDTRKTCCCALTTKLFGIKTYKTVHHDPTEMTMPHLTPKYSQQSRNRKIYAKVSAMKHRRCHFDTLPISLILDNIKNFLWRNLQQGTVMETSVKFQRDSTYSSWIKALWKFALSKGAHLFLDLVLTLHISPIQISEWHEPWFRPPAQRNQQKELDTLRNDH